MQPVGAWCLLPPRFSQLIDPLDQAAEELNCDAVNAKRANELRAKHAALVEWINAE